MAKFSVPGSKNEKFILDIFGLLKRCFLSTDKIEPVREAEILGTERICFDGQYFLQWFKHISCFI